ALSGRMTDGALVRLLLTVPLLGFSSSLGSFPEMASSFGQWADDVTGVVVPDAGHFIPDEQPEAVAAAIADFILDGD
ncbi:alpha/beta hydrolase, partial [Streptomyces sp. NPDC020125]